MPTAGPEIGLPTRTAPPPAANLLSGSVKISSFRVGRICGMILVNPLPPREGDAGTMTRLSDRDGPNGEEGAGELRPRLADEDKRRRGSESPGSAVITRTKPQTKRPAMH